MKKYTRQSFERIAPPGDQLMHQMHQLFFLLPIELRSYTDTENSKTGSNSDSDSKTSDTAKTVIATKGDLSYTDFLIQGLSNEKKN